ncbi:MAG: class I SAM-dependent methyltransferase family protein [Promethearchaeota archaeon]
MRKSCIQVEQRLGEQLRRLLVEYELLDTNFPITKDENQLFFPLSRKLKANELKLVTDKIGPCDQMEKDLEPLPIKPSDLSSALDGILPKELHQWLPHSLDIIGEIAVVELHDALKPYDVQIGEAIMLINSRVNTVYAKEGGVEGVHRLRPLRLIAGEGQKTTIHIEYGVKLAIDVTQTYFSPRLGTEHDRVASLIQPGEVIVDMFTGVGPFALQAAKRHKVQVYAIDINPQAIQCLQKSLEINRLVGKVIPIAGDARTIIDEQLKGKADRVIMNLPNYAFSFLDSAAKAIKRDGGIIHFYGVTTTSRSQATLETEVLHQLAEYGVTAKITTSRVVRPAAPHEEQIVLDLQVVP